MDWYFDANENLFPGNEGVKGVKLIMSQVVQDTSIHTGGFGCEWMD